MSGSASLEPGVTPTDLTSHVRPRSHAADHARDHEAVREPGAVAGAAVVLCLTAPQP